MADINSDAGWSDYSPGGTEGGWSDYVPEKPKGMVSQLATSFGKGAKQEVFGGILKPLALAASTPFMAFDAAKNAVTGKSDTDAQDWAFGHLVAPAEAKAATYAATPEEQASIPLTVARGLGGLAADLPVIAATGGVATPEVAGSRILSGALKGITQMSPVAALHGAGRAQELVEQGVDPATAYKAGLAEAGTTALTGAAPIALPGSIARRAVTGAISSLAVGELSKEAQNAVLEGHPELQQKDTPESLAASAASGALLGAAIGPRAQVRANLAKEIANAKADVEAGVPLDHNEPTQVVESEPAPVQAPAEEPAQPPAAQQAAEETPTPVIPAEEPRLNTQLGDALQQAQDEQTARTKASQIDAAYTALQQSKERDLTAIQNVTKGEELANAAEQGRVPPEAQVLPVSHNQFLDQLSALKEEDQNMPPRLKQQVAQTVLGKTSYEDQVTAIGALRDAQKPETNSYELLDKLHKQLTEGQPETVPAEAEQPAQAAAPEVEQPRTVRDQAQDAADTLDNTVAQFNERVRGGEQLSTEEQGRLDAAQNFRKVLSDAMADPNTPDDYLKDLSAAANQTAQPSKESFSSDMKGIAYDQRNAGIVSSIVKSNDVNDTLDHIISNTGSADTKELAQMYKDLGLTTTINLAGEKSGTLGNINYGSNNIQIYEGGETEHVVMHEVGHAATGPSIKEAENIDIPQNQREAQLKTNYSKLEAIRNDALKVASAKEHYGLTDQYEFQTELWNNPKFQDFLKSQGGQANWFAKAVDAVRGLIGLPPKVKNAFEQAMELSGPFLSNKTYEAPRDSTAEFNSSYKGASDVTDNSLSKVVQWADSVGERAGSWSKLTLPAFKQFLGVQTSRYIADRVKATPDMVAAGMATGADGVPRGVDLHLETYELRHLAADHVENQATKYVTGVQNMLRGMDADDARALAKQMMRLGGESSLLGSDLTKNYNDNQKALREAGKDPIAEGNKAYVDGLHREFTQLQRSNPQAAQAILDGAKVFRAQYVDMSATVLSKLMDSSVGNMRRLAAELDRLSPDSAEHAAATERLHAATQEGDFALRHAPLLDFMSKDLQEANNGDTAHHIDGASYALDQRIKNALDDARHLPDGSTLKDQIAQLADTYEAHVDNPYYSLGRNGDYFVNVGFKDMDATTWQKLQDVIEGTPYVLGGNPKSQDHAFFRVENIDQAQGLRRLLKEAGGDKIVNDSSGMTSDVDDLRNSAGLNPALRSILDTLHDTVSESGVDAAHAQLIQDALTRQFLQMLPETSAQKSMIRRQGVPGYDGDFLGNFSRRASGSVQDISNIYTARTFAQSFREMKDAVSELNHSSDIDTATRAQMVTDELSRKYQNQLMPVTADTINQINSLSHSFYLAGSPGFLIRTMAQPWHRGLPYLGSRYGFVNAAKELSLATGTALKIIGNSVKSAWGEGGVRGLLDTEVKLDGLDLPPEDMQFAQEMHDRGVWDLGQARQLQRAAMPGSSPKMQDALRLISMTAQYSEILNRIITGFAAFRLAQKGRSGIDQKGIARNTEYAKNAIEYVMDNFDSANVARQIGKAGFAGKVTPLMTQFLNYNLQTTQQIARTVHDGIFNIDQSPEGLQRSAEAKKEFAGLMGTTAMISGVLGLPFVNAFAGLYNWATKDENNPSDIRIDTRNFLSDVFGQQWGDIISHGAGRLPELLSPGMGVDTSTFGLQDLLPGTSFLDNRRLLKDRLDEQSKQMLGPAANAGLDIINGYDKISDGYYVKGIEAMLPNGLKSYYKAAELATNGYTDQKGNPIGMQATPWDVGVQALGLSPADKANRAEAANFIYTNEQLLSHRKDVLEDQFYKNYTSGDQEAANDTLQQINDFNQQNPVEPIRNLSQVFRRHALDQATAEMTGTGVGTTARKSVVTSERARFAAMPTR